MARRRNTIAQRFAKMRGLPPSEKALMQRIGNLLDSALNNRQASNPFENARKITSRDIYPPTGILVKKGIRSVKVIWDPTPSNLLLRYEVTFDNLTTGERTIKSSFTNEVTFKAPKGSYVAKIVSIGRDHSTSLVKTIQFTAGEEVMLLEGAKNGPLETGVLVQDDIRLLQGYNVYIWGSYVLDKYAVANSVNEKTILKLYRALGPNGLFSDATLIETIEMFAATESGSNLDATARGGLITRPISITLRDGSFETSQSVMFTPVAVVTADIDKTFTYFLQATEREADADEVNLSITMWTGAVGDGDSIQGPVNPDPAYVFPNQNCFHTQMIWRNTANVAFDTRSMYASVEEHANLIANQWTVAMWFRPDSLNALSMSAGRSSSNPDGGALHLLSRLAIRPTSGTNYQSNSFQIKIVGLNQAPNGEFHEIQISAFPENGTAGNDRSVAFSHSLAVTGSDGDISAGLFSWGGAPTASNAKNDAWYFIVVCFEGGDFINDNPSKLRCYLNSGTGSNGAPIMVKLSPSGVDGFANELIMDDTDTMAYNLSAAFTDGGGAIVHNVSNGLYMGGLRTPETQGNMQVHQLGIWNIALDRSTAAGSNTSLGGLEPVGVLIPNRSAIEHLFNKGQGTLVDWTAAGTGYPQASNLCHLIQFGAVEQAMSTGFPGRDTGYHVHKGDLNFTGVTPTPRFLARFNYAGDPPDEPETADNTGNHYTDNTTIADILSPDGANGTTQFDKCFPGQNL